ncbi:MAG: serine/threonine-protein kinase, partial [Nannocystaceae bacterium]
HVIRIAGPARERLRHRLRAGTRVGRYNVLAAAGEGAMSIVFAAYDSELDRRVALKVFADGDAIDKQGRFRLKREAQALARLSHPNVVQVYDVGEFEGAVYVAMEFVRGPNLQTWLASKRHWQEVLSVFTQAARGLAAAHRRQLIHRDFKPSNVLIGHDDRVRVVDFGLARSHDDPRETSDDEDIPASTSTLRSELTHVGDLIGTPAYMSPEQHMREPATPLSDQYSFCVSLFEALYGCHPYPTDSVDEAALRACSSRVAERPRGTDVPNWLYEVVRRGMDPAPEQRWSSMDDILLKLDRPAAPRTRRFRRMCAIGVLTASVSAAFVIGHEPSAPTTEVCTGGYTQIQAVWSPHRAQSVVRKLRQ